MTLRGVALVTAVLVTAALGGWRAASMASARPNPSTLVVNGISYTVTHAEQVKGLSDSALGGMSHGIQNLVTDDKALVTLTLVITAGDSPGSYNASVLRAFKSGSTVGISPVGGIVAPGRLRAHASIEGFLSFVVPRDGARFTLRAPGSARELQLLKVDQAPAGAGKHLHPSATPATGGTSALVPPGAPAPQAP